MTANKCHDEALQAYDRALKCNPSYAKAWLGKATTLLELKRYDEALPACDEALKLNSGQYEILYTRSLILKGLERLDEAHETYVKSLDIRTAASPVFIAERRATQKGDILIISHNPKLDDTLRSFEDLHFDCFNYPGQLAGIFKDDFHFTFVFERNAIQPSTRKQIPQPDLVINNIANGQLILLGGNLSGLNEMVESFGVPVVNHPLKAIQTTRDMAAKLLGDIPGVVVPKTMRFSSVGKTPEELAHEIEGQCNYPLITRTLMSQQGVGMIKADSRGELLEALSTGVPENFFVTEFVDSKGNNEFYRKIRAAIVKDEIVVVRADYNNYWNVHGRKSVKRVSFYMEHLYLLDEEKRICKDPEAALGQSAMQSLRAIRERIPMDIFGIDFDVDADGRLIFYEANATMNLLSTARKELPNPKEADDRLKDAFHRYLTSLMPSRRAQGSN